MGNTSFLSHVPIDQSSRILDDNIEKGNYGERMVASFLVLCLGAEIRWGSRNEDSNKWDLIVSYDVTFANEKILTTIQVKTGASYADFDLKNNSLTIEKHTLEKCYRTKSKNILVWFDIKTNAAFLYIVSSRPTEKKIVRNPLKLDPSISYFLTPLLLFKLHNRNSRLGITINTPLNDFSLQDLKNALFLYRDNKEVINPIFGKISLTKVAWKHMFRRGRRKKRKMNSLLIVPYIPKILEKTPTMFYTTESGEFSGGGDVVIKYREQILIYKGLKVNDVSDKQVIVRLRQEVRFHKGWATDYIKLVNTQGVTVLRTIYLK